MLCFSPFSALGDVCVSGGAKPNEKKIKHNSGAVGFPLLEMDLSIMNAVDAKNKKSRSLDDIRTETDSASSNSGEHPSPYSGISRSLSDIQIIKTIGSGRFGLVKISYCNILKKYVILNTYQKTILVETCQQHIPTREKDIVESLKHPFITNLMGSFQNDKSLFLMLEFYPGGDLSRLLISSTTGSMKSGFQLKESDIIFYAACVVSVLKYAHSKNILYRGLHPDTLFIDEKGYLKVTDWGFAKKIDDNTFTLCGHVEYLCPEAIVYDSGYGKGADYWALGVLIYEMLAGRSAFVVRTAPNENDPNSEAGFDDASTVENIITSDIVFPSSFSAMSKTIISGLCQKNPSLRLGCIKSGRGIKDIMSHHWFHSIDWEKLERKQCRAPWIPTLHSEGDLRYFGDGYFVDEPVAPFDGYNHKEWNSFSYS